MNELWVCGNSRWEVNGQQYKTWVGGKGCEEGCGIDCDAGKICPQGNLFYCINEKGDLGQAGEKLIPGIEYCQSGCVVSEIGTNDQCIKK